MSGDVQPRKRNKDNKNVKKKKDELDAKATAELIARKMSLKDDDSTTNFKDKPSSVLTSTASKIQTDDIQLHVHSEHGTGGHWCAKIVFFSLMAILAGLIGLILLENRGLSDLDTPLSESRFAEYLDGWVDEEREHSHDEHDVNKIIDDELNDHEHDNEPFAEEEDHDDDDDDDDNDEEDDNGHEDDDDDGITKNVIDDAEDDTEQSEEVDGKDEEDDDDVDDEVNRTDNQNEDELSQEEIETTENLRFKLSGKYDNDADDDNDDEKDEGFDEGEDEIEHSDSVDTKEDNDMGNDDDNSDNVDYDNERNDITTDESNDNNDGDEDDNTPFDEHVTNKICVNNNLSLCDDQNDPLVTTKDPMTIVHDSLASDQQPPSPTTVPMTIADELEKQLDDHIENVNRVAESLNKPNLVINLNNVDKVSTSDELETNDYTNDELVKYWNEIHKSNEHNFTDLPDWNDRSTDIYPDVKLPDYNVSEGISHLDVEKRSIIESDDEDEDDDDEVSFEQVVDNDEGEEMHLRNKAQKDNIIESVEEEEDVSEESGSLAVKIGVGLALVIVAHIVLLKRSNRKPTNDVIDEIDEIDPLEMAMKRRLTLVTPDDNIPSDEEPNLDQDFINDEDGDIDDDEINDQEEEEGYDDENYEDEIDYSDEPDDEQRQHIENEDVDIDTIVSPLQTFEEMASMYRPKSQINETATTAVTVTTTSTTSSKIENLNFNINPIISSNKSIDKPIEAPEQLIPQTDNLIKKSFDNDDGNNKGQTTIPKIDNKQDVKDSEQNSPNDYERDDSESGEDELDEDEEDIDESDLDEDEELLKRLDEKYGKLPVDRESSIHDDDDDYDADNYEDDDDDDDVPDRSWTKIKRSDGPQNMRDDYDDDDEIMTANNMLQDNPALAIELFESIIQKNPKSFEAMYGKALALDKLSEEHQSNVILDKAIEQYIQILNELGATIDDVKFKTVAEKCIERMRFKGQLMKAVSIHETLIERFNDDPFYRNQLAVTYLLSNKLADAKFVLHETLLRWREDGFACVHYGFVLKILDNNLEAAVSFLRQGIETNETGTQDGRFYFHLGDALNRLGRGQEAFEVYRLGVKNHLFLSEYQRSLYNVNRLKSKPFWSLNDTTITYQNDFRLLEINWEQIRDEGKRLLNDREQFFVDETENLRDRGDWKQFELYARGGKNSKNCQKTPFTCKMVEYFTAAQSCTRGQIKFSVMHPGTHVWPHCGPTNCRLRAHLGLIVPKNTFIRVANETRTWEDGKLLIFDDSFEHEVWHNGTSVRLVLIIDVWHPDLTEAERKSLTPI